MRLGAVRRAAPGVAAAQLVMVPMASSHGSARTVPSPRSTVRRERDCVIKESRRQSNRDRRKVVGESFRTPPRTPHSPEALGSALGIPLFLRLIVDFLTDLGQFESHATGARRTFRELGADT